MAIGGLMFAAAPAAQACDNTTLKGIYSTTFSGHVGSSPLAVSVVLVADGLGNFSGDLNESIGGKIVSGQSVTGIYNINTASCGGSAQISNSFIGTIDFVFSMTAKGKFFSGIETDRGTTVTVTGQR
ncbi:MAG TPA: hypothetical protein VGR91_16975 [Stellaceae bacterium]|nr:hypothetical protein [Stellaceae bacterium]